MQHYEGFHILQTRVSVSVLAQRFSLCVHLLKGVLWYICICPKTPSGAEHIVLSSVAVYIA